MKRLTKQIKVILLLLTARSFLMPSLFPHSSEAGCTIVPSYITSFDEHNIDYDMDVSSCKGRARSPGSATVRKKTKKNGQPRSSTMFKVLQSTTEYYCGTVAVFGKKSIFVTSSDHIQAVCYLSTGDETG